MNNGFFQNLMENLVDVIISADEKGEIIFVNRAAETMFGYKKEEILGKSLSILMPPRYQRAHKEGMARILAGGEPRIIGKSVELVGLKKNGQEFPIELSLAMSKDPEIIFTAVIRDISERKKIEEEMRVHIEKINASKKAFVNLLEDIKQEKEKSESLVVELSKFQLAVESASEHIVITDPDAKILYANKAAEKITGYSRGELIGNRPSLFGKQMSKEFYEKMWQTIKEEKKEFFGEITNKRKDGKFYIVDARIHPILDKSGKLKFFVGIERDITEAKEVERVKSDFISLASHQLRTPLTSIKWISDLFIAGDFGKLEPKQKEFMKDLYDSTNRMISLINSLLNIARIESDQLEIKSGITSVDKIYNDLENELKLLIEKHKHEVKFIKEPDIPSFETDEVILYEILKNLLTNSIKYTPDSGKISVSASLKDNKIFFTVKDNGYGIPAAQQSRMFQKFFRGDNIVKIDTTGTGLGMYIVKSLVELLGGSISFESQENKGTAFYVDLPLGGLKIGEGTKKLERETEF